MVLLIRNELSATVTLRIRKLIIFRAGLYKAKTVGHIASVQSDFENEFLQACELFGKWKDRRNAEMYLISQFSTPF